MTASNQQVKLLMKKITKYNQESAAAKAGMDVKTARKYIKSGQLPSEMKAIYQRTTPTLFAEHWADISKFLEASPGLQAKTILGHLVKTYPEQYQTSQLRTLQRHMLAWRAEFGQSQPVIFSQDIKPGKQSQSDYTCMNALNVTINGREFKHLLFHFMLPYSHWESIHLCLSETFVSLTLGYEKAVWELGCTAKEHRTDNLSAATQAMGNQREFTSRWQQFMAHYDVMPTTNNRGVSHENGSVEKSHDTLKNAIVQELMLRGSHDFLTEYDYITFVEKIVAGRNEPRNERLQQEFEHFIELPDKKWHSPEIIQSRVSTGSIINLLSIPYTVPSRLIHYTLKAYIYPDEILLFYGNKKLQTMPRLHAHTLAGINYRHIIDGLVRKPGAFANYQYHEALFPRLCFRQAYDRLQSRVPGNADRQYLKLLQLAKLHSEHEVSVALELLLETDKVPLVVEVKALIDVYAKEQLNVHVDQPNIADYDHLLSASYAWEVN